MKRVITLLFTGWVSACINVPEIEPGGSTPPPDAGTTEAPDSGVVLSDLSVTLTSPAETTYSSTAVTLTAEVRGGVANAVQYLRDGKVLATLTAPPYPYTWDTTQEAEGRYSLTARAFRTGKSFDSAPVAVIVDRTSLLVASKSPVNGSINVDYRTPIQVVFTKPVKATTVNDSTVSLKAAGAWVEKTLTLSSDGKTLTLTPKERPTLPATFSLEVSLGITDLAGNALANPITSSSTPWSFEVPDWYSFGGPLEAIKGTNTQLKDIDMVFDRDGNPIVAWSEELTPGGRSSIFVYRWDGKAFAPLGGPINATSTGSAFRTTMALGGDGNPVIAWEESDGFNENIYVKRWTGSLWQTVGTGPLSAENDTRANPIPTPAHNPSIAAGNNDIYVAWDELNPAKVTTIHVWHSTNGEAFSGVGNTTGVVDAVNQSTNSQKPSLILDSNDQPVVGFQEETAEKDIAIHIYVMRLQNGAWVYATPPPSFDGSGHYTPGGLSGFGERAFAENCHLDIDEQGILYLTWDEQRYADGQTYVYAFKLSQNQTWAQFGQPLSTYRRLSTPVSRAKIKASTADKTYITWQESNVSSENGGQYSFLSRWDKGDWTRIVPAGGVNQGQENSVRSILQLDSFERPTLAWFESTNIGSNFSGDYVYVRRHNE